MYLDITQEQVEEWNAPAQKRRLIQDIFPNLNEDEREFIMTGYTPADWKNLHENNVVPKNIFIDMDGVLVDFAGISELIGHPLGNDIMVILNMTERKEELTNKRLFRKLPPMVDYHELIGYVKHTGFELGDFDGELVQSIETVGSL